MSNTMPTKLTQSASWQQLSALQLAMRDFSLTEAFASDAHRAEIFSLQAAGIFLDYSKHLINQDCLDALVQLTQQQGLKPSIAALCAGEKVNHTEDRAALHWLLRKQTADNLSPELEANWQEIQHVKARMKSISEAIIHGQLRGYSEHTFTDIIHIGIGGSDLGPAMVYKALSPYRKANIRCHFIANLCPNDISETLSGLNPERCLFIIASKTFSTLETLQNAKTARQWFTDNTGNEAAISQHFFAVTANPQRAENWGVASENILPFWDWVGGRYSVWSAIGLSLCIGLGYENFERFLQGAAAMDEHFFTSSAEKNLPVILALLGVWYTNFQQRQAHAVVPYDHRLRRFPAYLQQLEMESTGKSANHLNQAIDYATCPDIWGEPGSNSQHSFFQQLHQGSAYTPIDFIAVCQSPPHLQEHQDLLLANCFAQSRALMLGQTEKTQGVLNQHTFMPGNKPSSTLMLESLNPETLGALMALYEHKVFTQACIWEVNPFDQWGVELGKKVSSNIKTAMDDGNIVALDPSTQQLLKRYQKTRQP